MSGRRYSSKRPMQAVGEKAETASRLNRCGQCPSLPTPILSICCSTRSGYPHSCHVLVFVLLCAHVFIIFIPKAVRARFSRPPPPYFPTFVSWPKFRDTWGRNGHVQLLCDVPTGVPVAHAALTVNDVVDNAGKAEAASVLSAEDGVPLERRKLSRRRRVRPKAGDDAANSTSDGAVPAATAAPAAPSASQPVRLWEVQEAVVAAQRFTFALPLLEELNRRVAGVAQLIDRVRELFPNPAVHSKGAAGARVAQGGGLGLGLYGVGVGGEDNAATTPVAGDGNAVSGGEGFGVLRWLCRCAARRAIRGAVCVCCGFTVCSRGVCGAIRGVGDFSRLCCADVICITCAQRTHLTLTSVAH